MRFVVISFLAAILGSVSVFASAPKISKPAEFEFIHCVPALPRARDYVSHYIIDIRTNDQYKLYLAQSAKATKASNLKKLILLDSKLETRDVADTDISWVSKKQQIRFDLNIVDNGGNVMDGVFSRGRFTAPVHCQDVSLEN